MPKALFIALLVLSGLGLTYEDYAVPRDYLEKPPGGKARVYFFFPFRFMGQGKDIQIFSGEKICGIVRNTQRFFPIDLEPGQHDLFVLKDDFAALRIRVAPEKVYLVAMTHQLSQRKYEITPPYPMEAKGGWQRYSFGDNWVYLEPAPPDSRHYNEMVKYLPKGHYSLLKMEAKTLNAWMKDPKNKALYEKKWTQFKYKGPDKRVFLTMDKHQHIRSEDFSFK